MCKEIKKFMDDHLTFTKFMELNESEKADLNRIQPLVAEDMIAGKPSSITLDVISKLKVTDKVKLILMSFVKKMNTLRGYDVDEDIAA